MRSREDCDPVAMSNIVREIIKNRRTDRRALYGFVADQTPPRAEIKFWTPFLNQDTPVYLGVEKIAAKYDMAVIFINIQKVRRGFYTMTSELLFEHAAGLPEQLITETHVKRLEEIIKEKPEFWLWSHRRWKHKREHIDD
jgi:KDO2-lipid IV(A) lauroyltransferase